MRDKIRAKTGGHLFVKTLNRKGVEFVFGTTGAGMPDIQDAMVVEKPPKWIQGLHEFPTVAAATGYALASGKAGVALIDRVVGTQNSIGAFYGAFMNSAPCVIFASANVPGVPIENNAFELHYSSYQMLMVSAWVKWFNQVNHIDTLQKDIDKAFFLAMSEHQGPVYVTLRQDLMSGPAHVASTASTDVPYLCARIPEDAVLEKIINEILTHENPQILVSQLGRHPSAVRSLIQFAHTFAIPVAERRFFLNFPLKDPLHVGFVSRYETPEMSSDSDILLALEIGLLPHQDFPQELPVIDLASDPYHRQDVYAGGDYGGSLIHSIIRASCDLGPTLEKLVKIGDTKISKDDRNSIKERMARVAQTHDQYMRNNRDRAFHAYREGKMDDWSISYVLNKHWTNEMIWINGLATSWSTFLKTVEIQEPGTYFGNPSGHLGVATGMAYGVGLAYSKYVTSKTKGKYATGRITSSGVVPVCTIGDGEAIFGNINSCLWTCKHYGIGVLYVILNNSCWGAEWAPIKESSQHWAQRAGDFEFLDLDEPEIDFSKISSAFSVHSKIAETPQEFERALIAAKKVVASGQPALLDVRMPKYTGTKKSVVK